MNDDEINQQSIKSIIKNRLRNINRKNIKQKFKIFVYFLNYNAAQVKYYYIIQHRVLFLNKQFFKRNDLDFRNRITICHHRQFKY